MFFVEAITEESSALWCKQMSVVDLLLRFDAVLSVKDVKIADITNILTTVNAFIASEANRYAFDDRFLSKFESVLSHFDDGLTNLSPIWTELFRFLRNYAAFSTECQNHIVRSSRLFEASFQRIAHLISEVSNGSSSFPIISELRCGIQFLGNLVTNNDANKRLLATRILSKADVLMSFEDGTLKKYSSMLIYNCLIGLEAEREAFLYSSHVANIVVSSFLSSNSSEWGLFSIQYFLESSMFLERFYPKLRSNQRIALLNILDSILRDSETNSRTSKVEVSISNLIYLATEFIKNANVILQLKDSCSASLEPLEMIRCLNVLCSASSVSPYSVHLQSVSELLCTTIVLLKSVHMAGKESSCNGFTPMESLSSVVGALETERPIDPSAGLKCLLIRFVANLCWENKVNQDKVREFEGIPLLLDCCKLDAKNLFIVQCVIFAIRNLCKDNAENQKLIANIDKKELAHSSVISELGFKVSEDENGRLLVKYNRDCSESMVEQTRRDIRDLFL